MTKREVMEMIDEKLNEVFAEIQKREGITDGDVEPMDVVAFDELTAQAADLILKITKSQKIEETMARAEREANLLRMKGLMASHEKWKAAHPRKKP